MNNRGCAVLLMMLRAACGPAGAGGNDAQPIAAHNDPLIYENATHCAQVWRAAQPGSASDVLIATPDGLTFSDIGGDVWRDRDDAQAIYLRQSPRLANTAFEVAVARFVPQDGFAQVGIVAWRDADNYVRSTVGFVPAGVECVGEFGRSVLPAGVHVLYPRSHPIAARLRLEIGQRTVCALVSTDHGFWQVIDLASLPPGARAGKFLRGVGLIGVGGAMREPPIFTNWQESPLTTFEADEFDHDLGAWQKCVLSSGWGVTAEAIVARSGHLCIQPVPGSDLFLDNLNYPCAMQPAPRGETWQLTTKLSQFDGTTPGRFRKAGMVLFQGRKRWLAVTIVSDDHFDHMYAEQLTQGAHGTGWRMRSQLHGARRICDAYLRITKDSPKQYTGSVSFDGEQWTELDAVTIELDEPRVQLFAGGDVEHMHPDVAWAARFDYLRADASATPTREETR